MSMLELRRVSKVYGQGAAGVHALVLIRDGRVVDQATPAPGPGSPGQGW